jgi:uncharacterized protein (TIGR02265 family)
MPQDDPQLAARLAAATPRDRVRGVLFNAAFDLVSELTGSAAASACDPSGRGGRREFFSYPAEDYLRVSWAAADALGPLLGDRARTFHALGTRATRRWLATSLGQTLVAFAGRDPRRLVTNASIGYRNVVSFGTRSVEWLDDRRARLRFERDFLVPAFHCGVLATMLEVTCGLAATAEGREVGFLASEYVLAW